MRLVQLLSICCKAIGTTFDWRCWFWIGVVCLCHIECDSVGWESTGPHVFKVCKIFRKLLRAWSGLSQSSVSLEECREGAKEHGISHLLVPSESTVGVMVFKVANMDCEEDVGPLRGSHVVPLAHEPYFFPWGCKFADYIKSKCFCNICRTGWWC